MPASSAAIGLLNGFRRRTSRRRRDDSRPSRSLSRAVSRCRPTGSRPAGSLCRMRPRSSSRCSQVLLRARGCSTRAHRPATRLQRSRTTPTDFSSRATSVRGACRCSRRRLRGHARQVEELIRAHAEDHHHFEIQLLDPPPGEMRHQIVERAAPPLHARGDLDRQPAISGIRKRLARVRQRGGEVGPACRDRAKHLVRGLARGRHAGCPLTVAC